MREIAVAPAGDRCRSRCFLLFFQPGIEKYQSRSPDRVPRARGRARGERLPGISVPEKSRSLRVKAAAAVAARAFDASAAAATSLTKPTQ
jgi:hypothetical protein